MAFIRRRLSGKQDGRYSYQILESYREGAKIKQRVLYNLGPSPTIASACVVQHEALAYYRERLRGELEMRAKPFAERGCHIWTDSAVDNWIEHYRQRIERTNENIAFLERVVVSNGSHWKSDTTLDVYHERLAHLSKNYDYDRLGM
jgi:hypothetical protein